MFRRQRLADDTQNLLARLQHHLTYARVLLASDQPQQAGPVLSKVLQEAHQHTLLGTEFETMLLQANLEQRLSHKAVATQQLATLERLARSKGFELIARKTVLMRSLS